MHSRILTLLAVPILALALFLLSLTACTQPVDDVIRFGLASEPVNLDPRFATDATSACDLDARLRDPGWNATVTLSFAAPSPPVAGPILPD